MFLRPIKNHWFGFQNTPDNAKDICEVEASNKIQENAVDKYVVKKSPNQCFSHLIHFEFSTQTSNPQNGARSYRVYRRRKLGSLGYRQCETQDYYVTNVWAQARGGQRLGGRDSNIIVLNSMVVKLSNTSSQSNSLYANNEGVPERRSSPQSPTLQKHAL